MYMKLQTHLLNPLQATLHLSVQQNLVSSSCLEHLDFLPQGFSDHEAGMTELNVRRFTQLQHEPIQGMKRAKKNFLYATNIAK